MRILQVIHQFPPYSSQGSEVYCHNLSRQLCETDDVRIFHVSNTPHWRRRLRLETHDGLPAYHCIDGREYSRLADWPNEFLRKSFQTVLNDFAPEIVHFHNFLSLGDDLAGMARARGAAIVYTLHDFGLMCPNALLLKDDGTLCHKDHGDFFQDCCPTLIRSAGHRRPAAPWAAWLPSLSRWRLFGRQYPRPFLRALLLAAVGVAERCLGSGAGETALKRDFFQTYTRRIFRNVDLFLAPSEFLRRRYMSCGVPSEKIMYMRYGMRPLSRVQRHKASNPVRFGYIGALHQHKGIELLLEAFRGLGSGASLHIYGSAFGSPISQNYCRRIRSEQSDGIVFHGAYDNRRIGEILSTLDAVVVPSIWYENSPLTIHEAFLAGVPVITADRGGMAEMVRDGIDGLHFRLGDAADLHDKMRGAADRPEILDRLRQGIPEVTGIAQHAAEMRALYRHLRRPPAPAVPAVREPHQTESLC